MAIEKLTNQFSRNTTTIPGYSHVYVIVLEKRSNFAPDINFELRVE